MIGAIIGDIVGSRFEFDNYRAKDFELFNKNCIITDDSIMTLAIAKAVMDFKKYGSNLESKAVIYMQQLGREYPGYGYGFGFYKWIFSDNPIPYNSYGNGSAMRVSACGYAADSQKDALFMSDAVTGVTHNHIEGLKGAGAVADSIFLAKKGKTKEELKKHICDNYYKIDFTIDEIRSDYQFNETCQDTVPQALEAFFESDSFEDTLRTAISIGGDSDTLAAITCSISEAYYGVPQDIYNNAVKYLDSRLRSILEEFEEKYGDNVIR